MDKRTFTFIVITIIFFMGYSYFLSKMYPPQKLPSSSLQKETLQEKQYTQHFENQQVTNKLIPVPEKLKKVEIGNFIVTISLTGGYIKNIYIVPYKEDLNFHNFGVIPSLVNSPFTFSQPADNIIVLENKEAEIRKTWEFHKYSIIFSINSTTVNMPIYLVTSKLDKNRFYQRYQEVFYKIFPNAPFKRVNQSRIRRFKNSQVIVAGIRDRYFCYALYNGPYKDIEFLSKDKKALTLVTYNKKADSHWNFYLGPQIISELKPYNLEKIINYGMFNAIGVLILRILHFFNRLFHSWGISILLLTTMIYLVLFPFTMKSTQAMKKMQEIQPYIQELQKKYKDDPQKLHKAQLELFKKYKVNPLGGCLPLFFQFPVFIALYQVLFRCVELKGARFLWIKDLSLPDHTFKLPFGLPLIGNYINVLPLFLVVIYFFQQKLTSVNLDSQQQFMSMFFVIFMGMIFYNFPAALVLYWLGQSLLTFIYQYRVKQTPSSAPAS